MIVDLKSPPPTYDVGTVDVDAAPGKPDDFHTVALGLQKGTSEEPKGHFGLPRTESPRPLSPYPTSSRASGSSSAQTGVSPGRSSNGSRFYEHLDEPVLGSAKLLRPTAKRQLEVLVSHNGGAYSRFLTSPSGIMGGVVRASFVARVAFGHVSASTKSWGHRAASHLGRWASGAREKIQAAGTAQLGSAAGGVRGVASYVGSWKPTFDTVRGKAAEDVVSNSDPRSRQGSVE